ncbi:MAG: hypothetical protein J1F33_02790 [Clostridiales bacterium]|nr:hypothetical protein [Clostridiales bacterium]
MYVIYIKFFNGKEGYYVGVDDDDIIFSNTVSGAKKFSSRMSAGYAEGYYLSGFEDIIDYTKVISV